METEPAPGVYRHYKGGEYEVLTLAVNSESGEELVVYQELKGNGTVWARPKSMFMSSVVVDGVTMPRFQSNEQADLMTEGCKL